MKVFISWSGPRSLAVAEALRDWLPTVINAVRPYVTSRDMDKGTVWTTEIMANLSTADLGIVCLTTDNLQEPWILFESGALAKAVGEKQLVCTYLLDVKPTDLAPPLSMFQATEANETDTKRMVESINAALGEGRLAPEIIAKSFPRNWPALAEELHAIPKASMTRPSRPEPEKLDEVLRTVRWIAQRQEQQPIVVAGADVEPSLRPTSAIMPDIPTSTTSGKLARERFAKELSNSVEHRRLALAREVARLFVHDPVAPDDMNQLLGLAPEARRREMEKALDWLIKRRYVQVTPLGGDAPPVVTLTPSGQHFAGIDDPDRSKD